MILVERMVIKIISPLNNSDWSSTGIEKNKSTVIKPLGVIISSGKIDFFQKNAFNTINRITKNEATIIKLTPNTSRLTKALRLIVVPNTTKKKVRTTNAVSRVTKWSSSRILSITSCLTHFLSLPTKKSWLLLITKPNVSIITKEERCICLPMA